MSESRIFWATWNDRQSVQALRRFVPATLDGGLREILSWPVYHVHKALYKGEVVGYASVVLLPDGAADDYGLAVHPFHRRRGIATTLRACQVRDLREMGWSTLYAATPAENEPAVTMLTAHFGELIGQIDTPGLPLHLYWGAPLGVLASRLPAPYPLTQVKDRDYLAVKKERALAQLDQLAQFNHLTTQKARLRRG